MLSSVQPSFSSSEVRRVAKRVAKTAADEAIQTFSERQSESQLDEESIGDELENAPIQSEDELKTEIESQSAFDIFTDVGEARAKQGDMVAYTIKKNGSMIDVVDHPYTWKQILETHGAGIYQIVAKRKSTGKFIKSQSQTLAAPVAGTTTRNDSKSNEVLEGIRMMQENMRQDAERREREYREERERIRREINEQKEASMNESKTSQATIGEIVKAMIMKPTDNSAIESLKDELKASTNNSNQLLTTILPILTKPDGTKEMMQMMMSMKNQGDNEAMQSLKEELKSTTNNSNQVLMTLLPLLMKKEPDTTSKDMMTMMMEMQKMNMQNQEKLATQLSQSQKELREDFMMAIKEIKTETSKSSQRDPLELYMTAVKQGMEQRQLIEELAEEKAEARASRNRDDDDEESGKKDSLADTVIKAAIPGLMGLLAQKNEQGAQTAPQISYQPRIAPNPNRGVLREGGIRPSFEQPVTQRVVPNETQGNNRQQNQGRGEQSVSSGQNSRENPLGMPSVSAPTPQAQHKPVEIQPESSILEKNQLNEAEFNKAKAMVLEMITPVFLEGLIERRTPEEGAYNCADLLIQNKINPIAAQKMFTAEEILTLCADLGSITEEQYPGVSGWIKEFYDNLPKQAEHIFGTTSGA
jgi:hypothetical protein